VGIGMKSCKYIQYIVLALTLLLLSGFIDNLSNGQFIITIIIGPIYFLGSFSLYIMGECANKRNPHIMFIAYTTLLIAYVSLEILFKEMYGR